MNEPEDLVNKAMNGEVFADLVEQFAVDPSPALRSRVLQAATSRRPARLGTFITSAPLIDVYLRATTELKQLLAGFDTEQWSRETDAGWSVSQLLTHLRVVDELATGAIRGDASYPGHIDVVQLTDTAISMTAGEAHQLTLATWQRSADELIDEARRAEPSRTMSYLGFSLDVGSVVGDRAFETWLHTQDIRKVIGLDLQAPSEQDLTALTELGARILTKLFAEGDMALRNDVQLVLDGVGGGSWRIPRQGDDETSKAATTLTLDPIDFCLLLGGRRTADEIHIDIHGDDSDAKVVIAASTLLARA